MQKQEYTTTIGGAELKVIFSDLANQASGSAIVQMGDTVVLATAVISEDDRDGLNYFPLTVDYEERFYASGQILGSRFMRREGRPSEEAILSGRLVDRTIRPLFDHHIRREVQIVLTILSLGEYDPDTLATLAASMALSTSNIPWNGPVGAIRIGLLENGSFVMNPKYTERQNKDFVLDIVACGKDGTINMIEAGAQEVPEDKIIEALRKAKEELALLQEFQNAIINERKQEKINFPKQEISANIQKLFEKEIAPELKDAVFAGPGKAGIKKLGEKWKNMLKQSAPEENMALAMEYYEEKINNILHEEAIENSRRPDGRELDEVRALYAKAGGLTPMLHGLGIFYRGGTHVLSALTLGGPQDSLIIDGMEIQTKKMFMHHYNFPPFAPGETGRLGGLNRRMIGHGALAEKAIIPVMPEKDKFPYTVRVVSEVMASNGSTSMASVCATTLALMDGGVPITSPVAGIASGLMYKNDKEYAMLTDIQGPEDEHGDMDFKVAGTRQGVTAIQMDVKVHGVPIQILKEALEKARKARLQILDVMEKEIAKPRDALSPNAPQIVITKIKQDKIGMIIGPGGKMINEIRALTQTEIEIEEDGSVFITGKNQGPEKARTIIEDMTREYLVGEKFSGIVVRITDFGAFVKIGPNGEGLVHISEIAPFRIEKVTDVLKLGQEVPVIIKEIDLSNRISLSIKQRAPDFIKQTHGSK